MSDKVRALVWDYYSPPACGAPLILAIALSDEADDRGGGIFQSNQALAAKTRQNERAVRRQLRSLEDSGVLKCIERSAGGVGKFSQYAIDIAALIDLKNPDRRPGLTRTVGPGLDDANQDRRPGFQAPLYKDCKDLKDNVEHGSRSRVPDDAEDERLARWMLERLRALNPKHREPSWRAWLKDLRRLRERDKRTHREIAELFAWANADPFWQTNILSPAKLREKWDQLVLRRAANGGRGAQPSGAPEDRQCAELEAGERCTTPGAFKGRDGKWRCLTHREREHEGAGA